MTIHMICKNITMDAFVGSIRGMMGAPDLGSNPVLDETGLKGAWNFDLRYSLNFFGGMPGADGDRVTLFAALEKLGLKLEQRTAPTEVVVVDSAKRQPTPDPPGAAEAFPVVPVPTEFEVADIKQTAPDFRGGMTNTRNGRYTAQGMPLRFLVQRAFNTNNREEVVGLPAFADSERFDITAKMPGEAALSMDPDSMAPMMRALLVERFKMKFHTEEREVSAYSLAAPKSKLKKADPNERTTCKQTNNAPGMPAGTMLVDCKNVTMDYFASRLQNFGFGQIDWPVQDATGLEGGYDISLLYSPNAGMNFGGPGRGGAASGENAAAQASDPSTGMTLFEALEKVGLKLERRKRKLPVIVIDHLEQKPTEN
jgi:uncharacterized protein (TIGR03435 family)